mmetsp:Transcript_36819/g.101290  ORF Transcript_36819/g.101290 Transcript_36819/m.101290 type:complete len:230 (-) Transcript_36819:222-911(-)
MSVALVAKERIIPKLLPAVPALHGIPVAAFRHMLAALVAEYRVGLERVAAGRALYGLGAALGDLLSDRLQLSREVLHLRRRCRMCLTEALLEAFIEALLQLSLRRCDGLLLLLREQPALRYKILERVELRRDHASDHLLLFLPGRRRRRHGHLAFERPHFLHKLRLLRFLRLGDLEEMPVQLRFFRLGHFGEEILQIRLVGFGPRLHFLQCRQQHLARWDFGHPLSELR